MLGDGKTASSKYLSPRECNRGAANSSPAVQSSQKWNRPQETPIFRDGAHDEKTGNRFCSRNDKPNTSSRAAQHQRVVFNGDAQRSLADKGIRCHLRGPRVSETSAMGRCDTRPMDNLCPSGGRGRVGHPEALQMP